ncbi:hypothetical protein GGR56DRAFT_647709 [Xylariaceae sp. FL0804]|nr:hypothetical protein GGR56DRAFT_647709 [Xylariaceae sp. FL0804]
MGQDFCRIGAGLSATRPTCGQMSATRSSIRTLASSRRKDMACLGSRCGPVHAGREAWMKQLQCYFFLCWRARFISLPPAFLSLLCVLFRIHSPVSIPPNVPLPAEFLPPGERARQLKSGESSTAPRTPLIGATTVHRGEPCSPRIEREGRVPAKLSDTDRRRGAKGRRARRERSERE